MKNELGAARDAAWEKYVNGDLMDVLLGRWSEESFDAGWNARGGQCKSEVKAERERIASELDAMAMSAPPSSWAHIVLNYCDKLRGTK